MLLELLIAVSTPPVHVVLALFTLATLMPAGKLSVKDRLLLETELPVLSIVKVSSLVSLTFIVKGAKDLLKAGGPFTVKVSLAIPLLPSDELSVPLVLLNTPGAVVSTSTRR